MKPITIVGGGLAGLTLGIGLRQRGIPVILWESRHYPRHRVCGEFISGRGQDTLARLGLLNPLQEAGAIFARSAAFFSNSAGRAVTSAPSLIRPLPQSALCLSRYVMDTVLAAQFQKCGGDLRENQRWQGNDFTEGVVRASGRRLQSTENGWRWFGLKVHARDVLLAADLEMHLQPDAYIGLCRLKDEVVNVCGLFRRQTASAGAAPSWQEMLRGMPGTLLHDRLSDAAFDEHSFCSVAGLSLRPERAAARPECCIGDALTMIPPVTGNGMSIAFESAELALEPLAAYSRGEVRWTQANQAIARACDNCFSQRLLWARLLQCLMFAPALQGSLGLRALRSGWLWRLIFVKTR